MNLPALETRNATLAQKIADKLSIRGADLGAKMRRAGRRLPRRLRREGRYLVQAELLAGHPKLAKQIDPARVDAAYRDFDAHLDPIDPNDLWWGWTLGVLAGIVFNLLLFAALLIALLAWRGDIGLG
ncbi:MAG: hypothetical protein NXH97_04805 [Rhodobacteraceae bacterium]|nr:hypothetical protein [Paracoccaceae bacterium]